MSDTIIAESFRLSLMAREPEQADAGVAVA